MKIALIMMFALGAGCAADATVRRQQQCLSEVAAEKEKAARESRPPRPIKEKAWLLTDVGERDKTPRFVFTEADSPDTPLWILSRVAVSADGKVAGVKVLRSSGRAAFDAAVIDKVKTWRYRPATVDCQPVAAELPFRYEHRWSR